jgi:hypothetical protein
VRGYKRFMAMKRGRPRKSKPGEESADALEGLRDDDYAGMPEPSEFDHRTRRPGIDDAEDDEPTDPGGWIFPEWE